jgi:hypothetical protein
MWILHSPPFIAPVNKYFTQSGGPDASNTEKFSGDSTSSTIIYAYAEIGTLLQRAAPMKTYGNHNYSTTKTNY